jgi:RNA polymerase sigma factor (sigma-70 family)
MPSASASDDPAIPIQHLLRDLAPQVLGVIVRRYRDFAASEDAVQEALIAAAMQWPLDGVPECPIAWLIRVASRRIADHIRAETARRHRENLVVSLVPPDEQIALALDDAAPAERDDTLDLLFMCCHPALSPASAIALTLRAVGGLTTAEIARAFLVPEATMAQRISRAKQTIKDSGAPFHMPSGEQLGARLDAVMQVLYLVFSEGYAATTGPDLVRTDLSGEALRLTRTLHDLVPDQVEVAGLLALMLLTDARRAARTGPGGELVPLDEQDRTSWDQQAIAEGVALVSASLSRGRAGPYQLQAAIAALHAEGESAEATDWPQIEALYGLLLGMSDNPMVALNHAIATAMVHGPAAGLVRLEALARDPRLCDHHRLDAVRAHLLERSGDQLRAMAHYRRAAERTTSLAERSYLLMRAARLDESDSSRPKSDGADRADGADGAARPC